MELGACNKPGPQIDDGRGRGLSGNALELADRPSHVL